MRYIGSKAALVGRIRHFVHDLAPSSIGICDLFAGTGAVGQEFKTTHNVMSNDVLYFCSIINETRIGLSRRPRFVKLQNELGLDPIEYLNLITPKPSDASDLDFVFQEFSPEGRSARKYLSAENAIKIDVIRQSIQQWKKFDLISANEHAYLLCSLIEAVPSVSNIAGTYGAFLKTWDKRALKPIVLENIEILPCRSGARNSIYNADSEQLIEHINGDVLYMDPPYNARQYSSNYHVLESIAKYDYPELSGKTGTPVMNVGSSNFCKRREVLNSFRSIVEKAKFGFVVVSYSNEGLLTEDELVSVLQENGKKSSLRFEKIPYRRYSRMTDVSKPVLEEFLIGIRK